MQIIIALLALSFLVIVHEFGHFIVAKLSGIKVQEFALFMGPKLFSVQRGETVYSIRCVPIGGYVKMEGEEEASEDERAFNKKPKLIRAAVIAAGPVMNLLVAVLIVTILYSFSGYGTTKIDAILEGTPVYEAGLRYNDRIIGISGKRVFHPMDVSIFLYAEKGDSIDLRIERDGKEFTVEVPLKTIPAHDDYTFGFSTKNIQGKISNEVDYVLPGSVAEKAGLKAGDRVLKLNDREVTGLYDIKKYMQENKKNPVVFTVERNGKSVELEPAIPNVVKIPERKNSLDLEFRAEKGNLGERIIRALGYTISVARSTYYSIIWLFTGIVSLKDMMGPIGIVTTIGEVVEMSTSVMGIILNLLNITAYISINLGMMNLIPFPALDGSKLFLIGVEGIRRKPISPEKEALITMIGFALLIMLMIFTSFNDVLRYAGIGPYK